MEYKRSDTFIYSPTGRMIKNTGARLYGKLAYVDAPELRGKFDKF